MVVRQGSRDGAWNAMPLILSGPVTAAPAIRMLPRLGILIPVVSFMKVDLPQPEGPTIAMKAPSAACSVMSSTANCPWARSSSL